MSIIACLSMHIKKLCITGKLHTKYFDVTFNSYNKILKSIMLWVNLEG